MSRHVKFWADIGYANASREEVFTYPDGTTDKQIQEDLDIWLGNFLHEIDFTRIAAHPHAILAVLLDVGFADIDGEVTGDD